MNVECTNEQNVQFCENLKRKIEFKYNIYIKIKLFCGEKVGQA